MIEVNMHEAKCRLSQLVKAAESGESVVLCRNGRRVAEIRPITKRSKNFDRLKPDPSLKVRFAPGFDHTEPLQPDELPDWIQ